MKISAHCGGSCQTNGYLVETEEGGVVVDAPEGMFNFCKQRGSKPTGLLLTHQHFDHIEDASLFQRDGVRIYASAPFSPDLQLTDLATKWGLPVKFPEFYVDEIFTPETRRIVINGIEFEPAPVPGHSPDSFVFHVALFQKLFSGDTLFASGGIGRTDFPHGDHDLLISGIKSKIAALPATTQLLPGHGPTAILGEEIHNNPYLQ
jgi:glyoxylase-like metal-dependent hydrolase (beta-lactamase superfamily II)